MIRMSGGTGGRTPPPSVSSDVSTRLLIVVIALLVVVLLLNIVPFLLNIFDTTPNVAVSNIDQREDGCVKGENPYYTYTFTFTLTNMGNVNTNATVSIIPQGPPFSDASPLTSKVFTVARGEVKTGDISIALPQMGCQLVNLGVQVTAQIPA